MYVFLGDSFQIGFVHFKTAPLDLAGISTAPQVTGEAPTNHQTPYLPWTDTWETQFTSTKDPDVKWDIVLRLGAVWGPGPQNRAKPPKFVKKTFCPRQHSNHCAATRRSTMLFKLLSRLQELHIRRTRGFCSDQGWFIFRQTAFKTQRGLGELKFPGLWPDPSNLNLVHICLARQWVSDQIQSHAQQLKKDRISAWVYRIKHAANSRGNYIFRYLRKRFHDEPPNLVQDA